MTLNVMTDEMSPKMKNRSTLRSTVMLSSMGQNVSKHAPNEVREHSISFDSLIWWKELNHHDTECDDG